MGARGTSTGRWRWLVAPFSPRGLSGFALLGFFLLSVAATGLGFADLRAANTDAGELSGIELAITVATTLFVVSAMVVALHHVVAGATRWWMRGVAFLAYLFFAVWTVGFGYGFFWKELAGQEFTERQFERVITGLSGSIARTSAALETSERATAETAQLAAQRADTEAREGRTCANHPSSVPGEGPLMRSRFAFADRARNLGDEVRATWIAPVAGQRDRLQRQVDALVKRAAPAAPDINPDERALLEELAMASRLPSAERRTLFTGLHEEARTFAAAANDLRSLHAEPFAQRLIQLAAEVGPDPARPGSADPSRAADPGYCWDVVLNEKLTAAAAQLRNVEAVATPEFEFLEGPKATRAAFFGLIAWLAQLVGVDLETDADFVFDDKAFLALFASIAVDLGIVFLTIVRDAPAQRRRPARAAQGVGQPTPPRLAGILGPAKRR
ncbi:MAG TPA: hypothetical protein VIA80_02005 [Hyphomonadaceae bacterium]